MESSTSSHDDFFQSSLKVKKFSLSPDQSPSPSQQEEQDQLRAEYDYLLYHLRQISSGLGGGKPQRVVLREEETLLGFQLNQEEVIQGYQAPRPYPWGEAFHLF
jgi:hypothetical protein